MLLAATGHVTFSSWRGCVHFYAGRYGFAGPDSGCLDVVRYAAAVSEGPVAQLETLQRQWHRKADTSLLS